MPIWFRRFRMQFDLHSQEFPDPSGLPGYRFERWKESLLEAHAWAKFLSFRDAADTSVFPSLGTEAGCLRLMTDISARTGFVPAATWLALALDDASGVGTAIGTIQGLLTGPGRGAIQNVGVAPECRGSGVGSQLVFRALAGFRAVGLRTATLEVTARNTGAVRLYQRLGFRLEQVVFKPGQFGGW